MIITYITLTLYALINLVLVLRMIKHKFSKRHKENISILLSSGILLIVLSIYNLEEPFFTILLIFSSIITLIYLSLSLIRTAKK